MTKSPAPGRKDSTIGPGAVSILVVDDEGPVRKLLHVGLQAAGYEVMTASDGIDALRVLEDHHEAVTLILTDVRMPGLDGCRLAEVVRSRWPTIRVLFMTGEPGARAEELDASRVIWKPFTVDVVLCRIQEELGMPMEDPGRKNE